MIREMACKPGSHRKSPNGSGSSLHNPADDIASEECAYERADLEYRADVIECWRNREEH